MKMWLTMLLWSVKLDYIFIFKIPDLPLGQRACFIFVKYLIFVKNKLFGLRRGRSYARVFKKKFYYDEKFGIATLQRVYCEHYQLKKYVAKNCTIVDIGANIGQFNFFGRQYLNARRIISVEPVKESYELLKLNSGVEHDCFNYAISAEPGFKTLFIPESSSLSSLIQHDFGSPVKSITVNSKTLNTLAQEAGGKFINLLKVDTEGSEFHVIQSGDEILQNINVITIEMSVLRNSNGDLFCTGQYLKDKGFKLSELNTYGQQNPISVEGIFVKDRKAVI